MIARPFLQNPSVTDKVEGPAASTRKKIKEQSTEQLRKLRVRKFEPRRQYRHPPATIVLAARIRARLHAAGPWGREAHL